MEFSQPKGIYQQIAEQMRDRILAGEWQEGERIPSVRELAAGVGVNLQVASNVVLAELSWTNAEQTQAIDRVHRIGQTDPVTAWRIIAAQTIDARIAELIDSKASLAARALDGSDEEVAASADIQLEAMVSMLKEALTRRESQLV